MILEIYKDKIYITDTNGSIAVSITNVEVKRLNNILECFRDKKLIAYLDLRCFTIKEY